MLEKDDIIIWVEEPLDSISAVDGIVRNVLSGSAKNCEHQCFAPVNQSSFLRILQMVFKRKFQRC